MTLEKKLDMSKIDKNTLNRIKAMPNKIIKTHTATLPNPKNIFEKKNQEISQDVEINLPTLIYDEEKNEIYTLNGDKLLELEQNRESFKIINRARKYLGTTQNITIDPIDGTFKDADTGKQLFEFKNYKDMLRPAPNYSLTDKLIELGFHEAHAEFITDNLDVETGSRVNMNTKNQVYFLKDVEGNKKVIKFVDDKKEAELEMTVNKKFSTHHILKQYVAGTDLDEPIAFEINGETKYAVIQNDITNKAIPVFEKAMLSNEKTKHQYLETWMNILAQIHHYGSEIMQEHGMMSPAETISCIPGREKDLMRLEDCTETKNNLTKIKDLVQEATSYNKSFIHFDAKPENRSGFKLIDWGNAGWGSQYLDVSMILNDARIPLSKNEKEHFVKTYIEQRNKLIKQEQKHTPFIDEKIGLREYDTMEFLINSTFTAYYASKNGLRLDEEARRDLVLMTNKNATINRKEKTYFLQNIKTIENKNRQKIYLPSANSIN